MKEVVKVQKLNKVLFFLPFSCFFFNKSSADSSFQKQYDCFDLGQDFCFLDENIFFYGKPFFSTKNKFLVYSFTSDSDKYFLFYNSEKNIPHGRSLEPFYVGLELFRVNRSGSLTYLGNVFLESSFESIFRAKNYGEKVFLFSNTEVVFLNSERIFDHINFQLDYPGYNVSDVFSDSMIWVKLSKSIQNSYLFESDRSSYDEEIVLFYDFQLSKFRREDFNKSPFYNKKKSLDQIIETVGDLYLGQDNSEGRIIWGQTYFLYGLLDYLRDNNEPDLIKILFKNINFYLNHEDLSFLYSKRYSYKRSKQLFLLHAARFYTFLKSFVRIFPNYYHPFLYKHLTNLEEVLLLTSRIHTVERFVEFDFEEIGKQNYFIFSKESDFWANGINVPINFVSDYIIALLLIENDKAYSLAEILLQVNFQLLDQSYLDQFHQFFL